ncbi:hypothetical protein JTB14_021564 [Gonioctena quinquepunctata]|nr:hypothetical protein JTB14_021564 [Gonioctena quinquepunctata]
MNSSMLRLSEKNSGILENIIPSEMETEIEIKLVRNPGMYDPNIQNITGRRIVDITHFLTQVRILESNECRIRKTGYLGFEKEKAGAKEYRFAIESGKIVKDSIGQCSVIVDGGWSHHSYGHRYSSKSGVACIIRPHWMIKVYGNKFKRSPPDILKRLVKIMNCTIEDQKKIEVTTRGQVINPNGTKRENIDLRLGDFGEIWKRRLNMERLMDLWR